MSKFKCIIIEDDPAFQTILKSLIGKIPELEILDVFDNSVDAALFITRKKPDLLFLDVEINGLSGLEVLDTLEIKPKTIVISSDKKYQDEASEMEVDAFMSKPIQGFDYFRKNVYDVLGINPA
ncbi:MAG: response regulator [Cyclobacteriaceae bacterium]|nr:response regulator [Cyclobacteriaceae bacterium]